MRLTKKIKKAETIMKIIKINQILMIQILISINNNQMKAASKMIVLNLRK